jgi:molybdate transport system regulatory protein
VGATVAGYCCDEEGKSMELSARNQLRGKIKLIRIDGLQAEVRIDLGGQEVVAVITASSAQRLDLEQRDTVTAIVKASDVIIGK